MKINETLKATLLDDSKRSRIKKLCEYIKSREELTKYKVLTGRVVSFMDEIRLGGVRLTVIDELIVEYEKRGKK